MDLAPGMETTATDTGRKSTTNARIGEGTFLMSAEYSKTTWYEHTETNGLRQWVVLHDEEHVALRTPWCPMELLSLTSTSTIFVTPCRKTISATPFGTQTGTGDKLIKV